MQNVEFKCELREPEVARSVCARLGARVVGIVEQRDTYYRVFDGRLKKRESTGDPTEWIKYHRQDRVTNKVSHFTLYSEEEALERFGARPMPVWLIVEKTREVWMLDHVRIHLDRVKHLGSFLELEALVTRKQHLGEAHRRVNELRLAFGPILGEPIASSYSDLLDQHAATERHGAGRSAE